MALSIKNEQTEDLARKVAQLTGETLTDAIRVALEERHNKLMGTRGRSLQEDLMEIGRRSASRPVICNLSDDEILGYDEYGAPTR